MISNIASLTLLAAICAYGALAVAQDEPKPTSKLTIGAYRNTAAADALDVNLRHDFDSSTGWIADYRDTGFDQVRAGWQYNWSGDARTFVPSLQLATHGFAGASLYAEIGTRWFAILGFGRTNRKPYYNLNFDPNDSVQLGFGYRDEAGNAVSLYSIRDDRLGTAQTDTHLVWRHLLRTTQVLTVDLMRKTGLGDDGPVKAWAATATYEWKSWFIRLAADPHANFASGRQTRLSAGLWF
jgi:hypothetical protein